MDNKSNVINLGGVESETVSNILQNMAKDPSMQLHLEIFDEISKYEEKDRFLKRLKVEWYLFALLSTFSLLCLIQLFVKYLN